MASQEGDIKKGLLSGSGLFILLICLILLNVLFSFVSVRFDATEQSIYSLSDGTKKILGDLTQPVDVKLFFSASDQNLPVPVKTYAKRVQELLEEYARVSKGKVTVEVYDPKPDSDEEEWADKYGIEARTAGEGDKVYFGLVAVAADREEVIPYLDPSREQLLEYDLTRLIVSCQETRKKVVGIVSPLPIFGGAGTPGMPPQFAQNEPWYFIEELRKTYEVRQISPGAQSLPADLDLLFVFYPRMMGPKMPYLIDQFVLSGKNAVVYLDPLAIVDPQSSSSQVRSMSSGEIDNVMRKWGVVMVPGKAVADLSQATRVRNRFNVVEESPMWITVRGDSFDKNSVVTSGLDSMLLPVAGALEKTDNPPAEWEELIKSTKESDILDAFAATLGARTIKNDFVAREKEYPMAVRIKGSFKTAYPDGPPAGEDDAENQQPKSIPPGHLAASVKPSTIIILTDVDNLADDFYLVKQNFLGFTMVRMFNDNLNFLLNACEILTGEENLAQVRTRGKFERPFTRVLDLEAQAQKKWLDKEQELMSQAEETNRKLTTLENQKNEDQRMVVSPEQKAEIERFKEQQREINKELKTVRKNLRADIERLGRILKVVNIFAVAFLVCLAGLIFAAYRHRKTRG
ncbi:MAG: Gldg family protein [Thermodesulfobacteriota bacterium]